MRDIILITGVRPQYIKAKALYEELVKNKIEGNKIHIIDIGQHYSNNLSLDIKKDIDLKIDFQIEQDKNSSQVQIIGKSLIEIDKYFYNKNLTEKIIIVFGDANPALVGALVALKTNTKLIHVEAGARRDKREQEHWNSKIVDDIANLKLCVTNKAKRFLEDEGNGDNSIVTGDICYNWLMSIYKNQLSNIKRDNSILVTIHRAINIQEDGIQKMLHILGKFNKKINWVLHPRTVKIFNNVEIPSNIVLSEPMSHIEILKKIKQSDFVITDSGGVARESHFLKKLVLMRRDIGGWQELNKIGALFFFNFDNFEEKLKIVNDYGKVYPKNKPLYIRGGIEKAILEIQKLASQMDF